MVVADSRITVLPDPAEVFDPDQAWFARVLHPFVSIDLAAVHPHWTGWVHLLSPVEPESGLLGEDTMEHHDDFTGENWVSFRVSATGRIRPLGDRRYFGVEDACEGEDVDPTAADAPDAWADFYARAAVEMEGTRARDADRGPHLRLELAPTAGTAPRA